MAKSYTDRVDIESVQFLSLRFNGGVPAGATVQSVKLYVEQGGRGGDLKAPSVLASRNYVV